MKRFAKSTLYGFYLFLDQQPNKFDLESYRTLLYILSEIYLQEDLLNEINARQQEIEDIGHQITPIL